MLYYFSLRLIQAEAKKATDLFLMPDAEETTGLEVSAPEAAGYEFQSHGVVNMLEELRDKFAGRL